MAVLTNFPTQIQVTLGDAWLESPTSPVTLKENDVITLTSVAALSSPNNRFYTEDGTLVPEINTNRLFYGVQGSSSVATAYIFVARTVNSTVTTAVNLFSLTNSLATTEIYNFKEVFSANPSASIGTPTAVTNQFKASFLSTSIGLQSMFSTLEASPSNGGGGLTDRQRRLYWLGYR